MSTLKEHDPVLHNLIQEERNRQTHGYELIASENYTSQAVLECLGSVLTNKYSEGLPSKRYYGGNEIIDKIENLCIQRALDTFGLDNKEWGVNVQPYSGSVANLAAYNAVLEPGDRLMGLDLPSGGHLSHGYYTAKRKISATSIFWESLPYHIGADGYIDYEDLEKTASRFLPKLLIAGASAYPRDYDFARFRVIADRVGAVLLCDMAHFSGLVATRECNNPFEYCDIQA
jgi:glycine hydroxymethyltransferase